MPGFQCLQLYPTYFQLCLSVTLSATLLQSLSHPLLGTRLVPCYYLVLLQTEG